MTNTRTPTSYPPYTDVVMASLAGDGDAVLDLVVRMDRRTRARLLNTIESLTEAVRLANAQTHREESRG